MRHELLNRSGQTVAAAALEEFCHHVRGQEFRATDAGYDARGTVGNGMIDRRPGLADGRDVSYTRATWI
jgi:hypothetical protein